MVAAVARRRVRGKVQRSICESASPPPHGSQSVNTSHIVDRTQLDVVDAQISVQLANISVPQSPDNFQEREARQRQSVSNPVRTSCQS